MRSAIATRTRRLPAILLATGWILLCIFAPWQQVHPSDNSLVQALSRAPLWSNDYRALPGAKINALEFFLEACLVLCAALLLRAYHADPSSRPRCVTLRLQLLGSSRYNGHNP